MSEIPPLCAGDLAELDELSRHVIGIGNDAFDRGERTREQLLDLPGYKMATGIQRLMAESKALRKRNEKLERVAVAASNVVASRNRCPIFGPFSDVATIPLDELETALRDVSYLREATLSDLDKEDT